MSDVTIKYKGQSIATMDASGTKTLQTQGKYCEDDIEVVYDKPAGPYGTKQISITQNGTTTEDVAAYANAEIAVNVSGGGGDDPYDFSGGNILAIVSHGTEYIDTDVYPSFNGYFCAKFKDVNETNYEYYWSTTNNSARTTMQRSGNRLQLYINGWGYGVNYPGYSSGDIITPCIGAVNINNVTANKPLLFFRGYYNGNVEAQIATYTFYGLNILDKNGEFVNRFRPWLNNGVACIKDLETGNLYTNGGTGAFDYIDTEGVLHSA